MLFKLEGIKKYYGQRKILDLQCFTLYKGDKVAVVGANGSGKTTLLRLIAGDTQPDSGTVDIRASVSMIEQFEQPQMPDIDVRLAGKLGIASGAVYSGGEQTKARIAAAISQRGDILLADEPTTNLDLDGIWLLQKMLQEFRGGLMLVSHDRELLSAVCSAVLEIERGECTLYRCGYDEYVRQKERERTEHKAQYENYISERNRLRKAADEKASKSASIRRTPRRMGNSEARLHKMGGQRQKAKLDSAAKAAKSRIDHLEKVEKPWQERPIVFDVRQSKLHNPVLVRGDNVEKSFDGIPVLKGCSFEVLNGKRTALIGANGSGKTTLMDMIAGQKPGIETCHGLKIGYFAQDIRNLDMEKSVLQNVMDESIYDECFSRIILRRLLFRAEDTEKMAGVLSGGERIRLSMAKIILSDFNLLLLDEPTNFLDIESRLALQDVLSAYPGSVLFVSHDRAFVRAVADRIVEVRFGKACTCECGFDEYLQTSRQK